MRDKQKHEIERLEEIVEKIGSDKDAGVASLKTLIDDMRDHIEA
jgi:hypothetical protein